MAGAGRLLYDARVLRTGAAGHAGERINEGVGLFEWLSLGAQMLLGRVSAEAHWRSYGSRTGRVVVFNEMEPVRHAMPHTATANSGLRGGLISIVLWPMGAGLASRSVAHI